ncbi:MAG: histidine phosphotransferase [Rhodobacteraceae bacterium]|nr:MAG: histidine phosphotransferase [Paracoccaceae bacterium]
MGTSNLNLAGLIGSRICHDLISPIGAIHNGLELIGLSQGDHRDELGLISQSADNAGARIRFFRLAFGPGSDEALPRAEIEAVLRDLQQGHRLRLHWQVAGPAPRNLVRLAFLGIMCAETAMPYGGDIAVTADGGTWSVGGTAPRLNIAEDLWRPLLRGEPPADVTPAHVQFALIALVAGDLGRALAVELAEDRLRLRF